MLIGVLHKIGRWQSIEIGAYLGQEVDRQRGFLVATEEGDCVGARRFLRSFLEVGEEGRVGVGVE